MTDEESYFLDPWQTKEVLDPDVESAANDSIVQMVFDHQISCIGHIIMSNYTWNQTDLARLIPFYSAIGGEFETKLGKVQQACEPEAFAGILGKQALLELPIYSKGTDISKVPTDSVSRVYHDPKEFLDDGSANETEVQKFVQSVMKIALEPLFSSKELKKVIKEPISLISMLMTSRSREDLIGHSTAKKPDYDVVKKLTADFEVTNFPVFHERMAESITNFLAYFALHTIRHHCYANFGVDGELKIYQRDMYKKALEDLRVAKSTKAPMSVSVKSEPHQKPTKIREVRVKAEKDESEDDFCEIIDSPSRNVLKNGTKSPKNATPGSKNRTNSESNSSKDFPEKYMLEDLDKDDLPMYFKTKFRKLVEQNQMLRDEIRDYKELIQLEIQEKKLKIA